MLPGSTSVSDLSGRFPSRRLVQNFFLAFSSKTIHLPPLAIALLGRLGEKFVPFEQPRRLANRVEREAGPNRHVEQIMPAI